MDDAHGRYSKKGGSTTTRCGPTMLAFYLSIPFMVLGVAMATIPLLFMIRREHRADANHREVAKRTARSRRNLKRWSAPLAHVARRHIFGFGPADMSEEAEAFVSGTSREFLERRAEPVPDWAWINELAHGQLADVERLASVDPRGDGPGAVVSGLARELLLQSSVTELGVEKLQRTWVIPLELELARAPARIPHCRAHLARSVDAILQRGLRPLDSVGDDPPSAAT